MQKADSPDRLLGGPWLVLADQNVGCDQSCGNICPSGHRERPARTEVVGNPTKNWGASRHAPKPNSYP